MASNEINAGFCSGISAINFMKINYLLKVLMVSFFFVVFVSCEKNNEDYGIEVRMRNENNGAERIRLLYVEGAYVEADLEGYIYGSTDFFVSLYISSANNFRVEPVYLNIGNCGYYSSYPNNSEIVCVGKVRGINTIKDIPSAGWAQQVAVQSGSGYIVRHKTPANENYVGDWRSYCRYARVYVEDWIESESGEKIGAVIIYQDDWIIDD